MFATSSYRHERSESEVSLKRYKYVFKELDNETGLYYYGMRFYAAWIARFVSVDPLQFKYPELTPFQYASNSPVTYLDLDGLEAAKSKINNVTFIELQNVTLRPIIRNSDKTFTQTAVSSDDIKKDDYIINTQLFDVINDADYYTATEPQKVNNCVPQGFVVSNEKIVLGRSSPNTFYLAQLTDDNIAEFGKGDAPKDYDFGIGGGIPVVIGGLKYGKGNLYSTNAPSGLPEKGEPGIENLQYLIQRNYNAYANLNNEKTGKSILGYNSYKDTWIIASQENGVNGMTLDQIRDYLINKGYDNVLAFDGSTSSTLVNNKEIITKPTKDYKNYTIPAGIILSVPFKTK